MTAWASMSRKAPFAALVPSPVAGVLPNDLNLLHTALGQRACFSKNEFFRPALEPAAEFRNYAKRARMTAAFR